MDGRSEGSLIEMGHARQKQEIVNKPFRRRVTIHILPDDVLLEIFDYYVAEADKFRKYEEWQMLVHVCQNWRYVVFGSPLRLGLRLLCPTRVPLREKLAVWPSLPIIIRQIRSSTSKRGEDNIIAALGHVDRVSEIVLTIPREGILAEMQKTFVALKLLGLYNNAMGDTVIPDSFLGGSAPHLRGLTLSRIIFPFPALRKLLLSAPNLTMLWLLQIPHVVYFSPEAMATYFSSLTRLRSLWIGFESPRSRPPREVRHPPPTPTVLPALTMLRFIGVSEYLEDLVSRIDAPLLTVLDVTFFHQLIFDTSQLILFISRSPKLNAYDRARVIFSDFDATISFLGRGQGSSGLEFKISCRRSDWQLSSLAQVCTLSFPPALIAMLEHLHILRHADFRPLWQDDLENTQWLELFQPFTAVKNLYLSREFAPRIALTPQEHVGERVSEVLPNLQSIFLEGLKEQGLVPEAIQQFIAARQLSGRPTAISHWTRKDGW